MAVLVRKNTGYPTSKPIARDFRLPEANQKQLEVIVRQGPSDQAAQNEYCGVVLLDLPPNVPKGAALTISFGLDGNGSIIATVQLRDYPDRRVTARIIRGGASKPEVRQRRDELVQKARKALEQGTGLAGAGAFAQQTDELERSEQAEDLEDFEKELAVFHAQAEQEREQQFALGASEMILQIAAEYLATDDEAELKRLSQNAQRALNAGKKEELRVSVQALMKFLDTHQIYLLLASLEMVRRGGKISQGLANRIGAGLTRLKSARSEVDVAASFKELMECWDEARRELEEKGEPTPGPVRPTD
jgi:molecular chaperone DnaK (HSP70)